MCPASAMMYLLLVFSPVNGQLERSVVQCSAQACETSKRLMLQYDHASAAKRGVRPRPSASLVCTKR